MNSGVANHQRAALRQKANVICNDFSAITMPMKRKEILSAKHEFKSKFGMFEDYETPFSVREKAAALSELADVGRQLEWRLELSQKISDEGELVRMINNMEALARNIEAKSALELSQREQVLLVEELRARNFGNWNLSFLESFAKEFLPRGKEFVLSADPKNDRIYLGDRFVEVGWAEKIAYSIPSGSDLCSPNLPVSSVKYDDEKGVFLVEAVALSISIPGKKAKEDTSWHLSKIFEAAKLDLVKFSDKLQALLMACKATEKEALEAINSQENYHFVFRTLMNWESADRKNKFLETRAEVHVSIKFDAKEGVHGEFGVEGTLLLPEKSMTLTSWSGSSTYTDKNAHLELQLKDAPPRDDLFLN